MRHTLYIVLALVSSVGLAGCAPVASQLSEATVEGAVQTVDDPENLRRIDSITASPEFQDSLSRVSASLVRGVVDELGDVDVDEHELEDAAEDLARGLGRGLGQGLIAGMQGLPDAGTIVDDAITGALVSASSEENRERARVIASDVTGTLIQTAMASMATGLEQGTDSSNPTLATPAAEGGLEHAIGAVIREASRQATLGFDAGMDEIRESNRAQHEGVLGRTSTVGVGIMLGLLGLLLLGAIVIIIVLAVANKRRREERERMFTTMWLAFAGQNNGLDDATRAELLRHFGVATPTNLPLETKAST